MTTETNPEIESPNLTASALIAEGQGTTFGQPKPGRGPTRSGVKFGDLLDDLGEMPQEDRDELLDALRGGATAKTIRTLAKSKRQSLKEYVADKQAEIDANEAQAELLARIETLSPLHRAALVKTLEPPTA